MNITEYHAEVDAFHAKVFARTPEENKPCCSRCTTPHCCSEPAYCDDKEADVMIESLHPKDLAGVAERTQVWLVKARPFLGTYMPKAFPYRLANIPCPLLGRDGRCMVYEQRPMGCRSFFALGKPEDCAMPARMEQKIAGFPLPNALLPHTVKYTQDNCPIELDHIGAHLVRKLLDHAEFTTASHERFEIESEPKPA